jgi:HK97 family phage prohead protease
MLIKKMISLDSVDLKMDGDTGKFSGYASVFGGVDSYGDTIQKGAFKNTLRENGNPKMFFNHDWGMPIGKWLSAKEDDHGLFVEGELTPGLSLSADVHAALKHGTLDGLSIGGFLKKGDYQETETGRIIRRWSSLMEVSPVVFPADGAARIDLSSVKSTDIIEGIEAIETIREFECWLRDAAGLSKGAAQALTARAKTILSLRDAGDTDAEAKAAQDLAARIARIGELCR